MVVGGVVKFLVASTISKGKSYTTMGVNFTETLDVSWCQIFIIIGGTEGCCSDNLQGHQWSML